MKRKTSKWLLKKNDIQNDLSICHYTNGQIIVQDFVKDEYYVFDDFNSAVCFVHNNYVCSQVASDLAHLA